MITQCPICQGSKVGPLQARYACCADCGVAFLVQGRDQNPPIINDDLTKPEPQLLRWFLERRCSLLRKLSGLERPRLLDVGCGSGRFLAHFGRYGQVAGVEVSPPSRLYATNHLGLEVFESLGQVPRDGRGYDIITFWHSLEHMDDPVGVLQAAGERLGADGFIFVSVPNAGSFQARLGKRRWAYHDDPNHLFEFSWPSLKSLLDRAGFGVKFRRRFSVEYGPFGALQTALNFLGGPHNYLYYAQKRGWTYLQLSSTHRAALALLHTFAAGLFALPAALFALGESALGCGAVLEVAAVPATRRNVREPGQQP